MTDTQIGVGIIGVEPGRSLGAVAQIPGFDHAVTRHELVEAVTESAATGRRVSVSSIRGRRR
jgi:predicted dehydrogenase